MGLRFFIFIFLFGFLVSGCSEIRQRRAKKKTVQVQSMLFRSSYFLSGDDLSFSFPVWFNDSLIRNNKVKTIVHSWYLGPISEGSDGALQRVRRFHFNESGRLFEVQQLNYYENIEVENTLFRYPSERDELGFASVEVIDALQSEEEHEYTTYSKVKYKDAYAVYKNDQTGDFLFCLLDKRFQGIVSVDSLFSPTPNDIVQYGSPATKDKRYQIENFVEEKRVKKYIYFKNADEMRECIRDNYPFSYKTQVLTNKSGQISGYIDSTFSAGSYLNRTVSAFEYNEKRLPSKLTHQGMRVGNFETFEYLFYE